jgi:hypothetical protein
MLTEDTIPQFMYLLYEGECTLTAKRNKYLQDAIFTDVSSPPELGPRGFLSPTIINCELGTLTGKNWVGEDAVFAKQGLKYTATAKGGVTAFEIRNGHFLMLPKECLQNIGEKAKKKLRWTAKRCYTLSKTNIDLLNDDMPNRVFQKSIVKLRQRFPLANNAALSNLRRVALQNEPVVQVQTLFKLGNLYSRETKWLFQRRNQSRNGSMTRTLVLPEESNGKSSQQRKAQMHAKFDTKQMPLSSYTELSTKASGQTTMRQQSVPRPRPFITNVLPQDYSLEPLAGQVSAIPRLLPPVKTRSRCKSSLHTTIGYPSLKPNADD